MLVTNWIGIGYPRQTLLYNTASEESTLVAGGLFDAVGLSDGTIIGVGLEKPQIGLVTDSGLDSIVPQELQKHIGAEVLASDEGGQTIWFTGDGQQNIYRIELDDGSVDGFLLPYEEISGAETFCIGRGDDCPDSVILRTLVSTLIPDGNGGVYFSDLNRARIGILRPK